VDKVDVGIGNDCPLVGVGVWRLNRLWFEEGHPDTKAL
jgi:hypothetical protein